MSSYYQQSGIEYQSQPFQQQGIVYQRPGPNYYPGYQTNFNQSPNNENSSQGGGNPLLGLLIFGVLCFVVWITFLKKDGKLSDWSSWSACTKDCGTGSQTRKRTYIPPEYGGKEDPNKDKLTETQDCNTQECVINGSLSDWIPTGNCLQSRNSTVVQSCGSGEQKYTRTYNPPKNGGTDVNAAEKSILSVWKPCETVPCNNQDGKMSDWVRDMTDINCYKKTEEGGNNQNPEKVSCGEGYYKETRYYKEKTGAGKEIATADDKLKVTRYNTISCGLSACPLPINAVCSMWNDTLTKSCIDNIWKKKQTRTYTPPKYGGKDIVGNCNNITEQWIQDGDGICPSDGSFSSNFEEKTESKCTPEKGTNRTFTTVAEYKMAVGTGKDNSYITNNFAYKLNDIKALNINGEQTFQELTTNIPVKFTRLNDTKPELYKLTKIVSCDYVPYYTEDEIKNFWKISTGCTQGVTSDILRQTPLVTTFDTLRKIENAETIKNTFKAKYSIDVLKNTDDYDLIKRCYGNDDYLVVKDNRDKNKLYIGTEINIMNGNDKVDRMVLKNNGWKLIFQMDGNLVIRDNNNIQNWASNTYGWTGIKLRMQRDGNLVIYNNSDIAEWSSSTGGSGANYLELNDNGYLMLKKSNEEIVKVLYPESSYISNSGKWIYVNDNSRNNCKRDWVYLNKDGSLKEKTFASVTTSGDSHPWCPTNDNSVGNKDKKPAELASIHGVDNIIHIVVVNYLAERIYIEPHIFKRIIDDNKVKDNDDLSDLGCNGDEYTAVNSYEANNRFNELADSSDYMANIFRNESGTRAPYHFYSDYGAWHDNGSKLYGCTRFYNLYANDRFQSEKDALTQDGFKSFHSDNRNQRNWIRNNRGGSKYETYWRVYYRTANDYVDYLNKNK